ncbi:MAG: spore maturation protein [Clostridia bacterium]|nr:spore maturation protein [Clostridia bacterium]
MPDSSYLVPSLVVLALLCGMRARIDVYSAFVRGAKEGLMTLIEMTPYLCAVLTAAALLRETGAMDLLEGLLAPVFSRLGIPAEAAGVVLLRPLSGSAAMAAVQDVIAQTGVDSRAARLAAVISGASETVFFTGSLYMGAAGIRDGRYTVPVALVAYAAGVIAAVLCI